MRSEREVLQADEQADGLSVESEGGGPTYSKSSVRAHAALRHRGHDIGERGLRRALARLDLDESEAAAVEGLVSRLVGRLLTGPERTLREADDEAVAEVVLALFDEE